MDKRIQWQKLETVVVLGLGQSGTSVVRFFVSEHSPLPAECDIRVYDSREQPPSLAEMSKYIDSTQLTTGGWQLEDLLAADLLVVSPGIDTRDADIQMAKDAGVPIVGDVEIFAQLNQRPVVAITGSNGKSTVTTLVAQMGQYHGHRWVAAGNIGVPVLDALQQDADAYVLELSSFQLETTQSLALKGAALLNVSADHLDRYDSEQAYFEAKLNIFNHAAVSVLNRQDQQHWPMQVPESVVTVGTDGSDSDYGLNSSEQGMVITRHGNALAAANQFSIAGTHNLVNIQAALALAETLDLSAEQGVKAIEQFTGLPHRCQVVYEANGVRWVDDSKATNIGATEAAINGLRPVIEGRLILIAGGDGKGAQFSQLVPVLTYVDVLLTIGRDGRKIAELRKGARYCEHLSEAVKTAQQIAEPGDWVVLSPACASLDQFKNFVERGEVFQQSIARLYERSA
ncbi:UDP-N-acetylmuramoylalanine--D-glutamate ligase [Idiomarina fontislapidosi]|uniref:UDP-N-acetylmuramoylalanine--D-glutamate ligase n=1 Tax=Idiomarina fontislapidosi TaxID=263723 RepID=A0A432Y2G1_9GAMM|nr:UDP-N-acetylmuramoyl-L-alanine--D-glutamate ligase [Idiomarina fontislapidosi]PYE33285.1 UDP-N-acetylmuramoylalanine--D-glutamate ligase [Idiomarina fontislapidosi]RUO55122.1 UDP-N-acetylmuramoyl-L-alanine--D-glutamate ligase [Idiomarina fontislapidosi]